MEIALIRHARPARVEHATAADPALDESGRRQAKLLADHLTAPDAPRIAAVYSSPMLRARQSAQPLADALGLTPGYDEDLVEYDHGMSFYIPTEEIEGDFEQYWADLQRGLYGGRQIDLPAFQARVTGAIDRIIAAHRPTDLVAVYCHGGVISAYLAGVVGSASPLFFEPEYTSISRVLVAESGRRQLLSAAETPHRGFHGWATSHVAQPQAAPAGTGR